MWFDQDKYARDDFGRPNPDAVEWQVIVSTSPDSLNLKPRGKELSRETFRSVEKRSRNQVMSSAVGYIKRALSKYR